MDPSRRVSLLAAVLTGQALASLGALVATVLVGGLDSILFLAPVDWGLGFLVSREASLAIAALLYLAGTATFLAAAHHVREGSDHAGRWAFLAALAGLTQLPAGVAAGAYGAWLARRPGFRDHLHAAPVLAGRGLRRLLVAWLIACAASLAIGALGVALLFAFAPLGLATILAATVPQGVLLWALDRRVRAGTEAVLPAMPALPEWSQES